MKLFSLFLAIIILASGLSGSPVAAMKMDVAKHMMAKHQMHNLAAVIKVNNSIQTVLFVITASFAFPVLFL